VCVNYRRLNQNSVFIVLTLAALLCMAACSGGDDGQGGAGGKLDLGMPLLADGTASDWCAPDGGTALAFTFGTAATCEKAPGAEPQVHFVVYPGSTTTLTPGQSWSFDETNIGMEARAWWYPDGLAAKAKIPKSGFVEVLSASIIDVKARYSFLADDGKRYGGEVTVWRCPSMLNCK